MSYFKVLDTIYKVLQEDGNIKKVEDFSNEKAFDLNKVTVYGLGVINITGYTYNENLNQYDVEVFILDQVAGKNSEKDNEFVGNSSQQDVYNWTDNSMRRFLTKLKKDLNQDNITIQDTVTVDKIDDFETTNRICGWRANIEIDVPNSLMDICETT